MAKEQDDIRIKGDPEFLAHTSHGQLDGQFNFWFLGVRITQLGAGQV